MQKQAIYIATIATLAIHIAVFATLYFLDPTNNIDNDLLKPTQYEELAISMEEIDFEELIQNEDKSENLPDHIEEKIRNFIENQKAEKSTDYSNYSESTNDQLEQEIRDRLKGIENDVIDDIHKDDIITDENSAEQNSPNEYVKSDKIWTDKDKSYNGKVMVSYKINNGDRAKRYLPTPGYKCRINGTVTINISVSKSGEISETSINDLLTNTSNECLTAEALKYANKSSFVSSINAPRKQTGTITYIFSAQ